MKNVASKAIDKRREMQLMLRLTSFTLFVMLAMIAASGSVLGVSLAG